MRIVIDAASAKIGGAVSYLKGLLPALREAMPGQQWIVLVRPEVAEKLDLEDRNIALLHTSDAGGFLRRVWWRQMTLRRLIKALAADALFSSANFAMFWCPVRQVLLVRNAIYFDDGYVSLCVSGHPVRRRIEYWLRRWLIHAGIPHADVLMTPTQALMSDIRRLKPPRPHSAQVVNPYGVKLQANVRRDQTSCGPEARRGSKVVRLLYVSLYADYKNLGTLLRAMPILNDTVEGTLFTLTTTADPGPRRDGGPAHEPDESSIRVNEARLARQPDIRPWVRFVGPLSGDEALQLYETCDLFVFPSYCESFGHPLVESMARGIPVVAADTAVNREMCQDAGVYFDALNPNSLAGAIQRVAADAALRASMRTAGERRAQKTFSWQVHVRRLARCFAPAASETVDLNQREKSETLNPHPVPMAKQV